jgi:hypothetical protein
MALQDYLKPEYKNTVEAREVELLYGNLNKDWRMTLRVPVDMGDAITNWLKRVVDPAYRFHRRTGGGKRVHCMDLSCLRKDATFFKFYFDKKD